jgi:nitrilase
LTLLVSVVEPCPEEGVMSEGSVKVAVVQRPPVLLDRAATMGSAVESIAEAAAEGAGLVVFPETFLPGYPVWIWRLRPDQYALTEEIHGRLLAESVDLSEGGLSPLQEAAAAAGVVVVCGIHEREGSYGRATIYNTLVTIGADGSILNQHRKLVPTNPERMVWGQGDASGLRVVDTSFGRLGGLICWENYMPLARYALYAQGVQVYVASTWDEDETWLASMRHIAAEGRCWVVGSGCALKAADVPSSFPSRETLFPDDEEWLNSGDSVLVAPGGEVVAGPLHGEYGILYGDIDADRSASAHRTLDVSGHYGRPDIFHLEVDRSPREPISFRGAE